MLYSDQSWPLEQNPFYFKFEKEINQDYDLI